MTMEQGESVSAEMLAARARLRERFGNTQQLGGKGTARRKPKKVHKSGATEDKKLILTLKKLGLTNIPGFESVFMLMENDTALHFENPKIQTAPQYKTLLVQGTPTTVAKAQQLIDSQRTPNIDPNMFTPEMIRQLKKMQAGAMKSSAAASAQEKDDEVPQLVENFEEVSKE